MLDDGSLPDKPVTAPQGPPMRAVLAAASTMDPDKEAHAQDLAQQSGMGVDLVRHNPAAAEQRATAADLDRRQLEITNPILAQQLRDPNFAGVAHDDLDSLSKIGEGAATVRAWTPTLWDKTKEDLGDATEFMTGSTPAQLKAGLFEFPLTRSAIDAAAGTAGMAGNIGSFFGWHGGDKSRQNPLQRVETNLSPEANLDPDNLYAKENGLDALAKNVAPVLATMPLTMGTGLAARALGLSENAAKVLSALSVGSAFSADQGGRTFTEMAAGGRSDEAARSAADLVAGVNLVPNVVMGLTDRVPFLGRNPMLASLGVGGLTGATGQFAQNVVTGQPWGTDVGKGALQGAAVMGGFHLGSGFMEQMGEIADAAEASKLRTRSPQAFQNFLDTQFDGTESLRIPAQDFVNYFDAKKIDPAVMANRVGVSNLDEATAAGSDLEIPASKFFGQLEPEHVKGLLPDVVDPSLDMTMRQADAGKQELQGLISDGSVEKLQAEYAQADAETQATPEWKQVYGDLKQRYVDAGENENAADSYATLQANAIANLAKNAGLKPDELLALHNPEITAGKGAATAPLYQDAIDDIRSVVEGAKQPGHAAQKAAIAPADPWLVETAKEHGLDLEGYNHVIDGSAVRHVISRHGDEAVELSRGQLPVTDADFDRIPSVIGSPDAVVFGTKTRGNRDQVGYIKRLEDGTTLHLEEVRTGKKELAAVSMRKYPAAKDFDSIAGTLPSNARSDGGEEPIIVPHPNAGKNQDLYQAAPREGAEPAKRGWFRVLPDGRFEIGKTKLGDFSTFIHEPAHAYLELFRNLTQREEASGPLKDDFKRICDWLGTTPEEAYKNGFTREQHEQWARGNEQYVREGKAPTSGLRRAFQNFSVWLGSIYRRASALGVELSPEIRGVMDRLYAGDEAVNRAEQEKGEQLFSSPEEAGWTEDEYRNYAEAWGLEVDKAREQVRAEMNDAAVRERTQAWREEKGNVRDAVTEQVDARPDYTAIRSLRKGSMDDGSPISLNRDALVAQFGEERVKALQDLHRGLYRNEGGTDAETAAELFGYGSGEEMMRALETAPRRAAAIETATRNYMTAKHGDIRYDGSLDNKARLAVENDERARNLHGELKALRAKVAQLEKKAADTKAAMRSITMEPLERYQEAAKSMVDQKAIADLQPSRYLNASRKFSREAFDALRKGDVQRAADAKNKELLNHFLFREASAARDYADKFARYAKRVQSRGIQQRLGLAGSDYRDQFNWLLARYKLGPASEAPDRSLRAWADDVYGQGKEVAIDPGILDSNKYADYRNVPLSEVRNLHDALTNIRHLAMQQFKMFVQGKQVAFAEAKQDMIASARENLKSKPEQIFDENLSTRDKLTRAVQYVDAMLMRTERLIEWLDGGKTGPWHDNVWNLASDAQGDEYDLQEKVTKQVTDALADMPTEMRRRLWTEKVNVEGIPEPLSRRRLLSMAFNMGNEGNLDRLKKTFVDKGWDPDAIRKIGGMLTREEWNFVQKAWDSLKPMGERMQELEKRLTGLPPAMVKVTPFKVALDDGTEMDLAGGYFPIVMDPRFSERAIQQDAKETAQNAMQSGYVRATTSKGYTKERTGFGGPLLLDYEQVLTNHVAKVAKDLSHREFMLSSQRLLLDTEVRRTLRETLGPAYEQQFMPWLRTIINDNNGSVQERTDTFKNFMQGLRGNIVAASLGFNASTSLLQISHAPRMLLYARPASLVQSFVEFLAHPIERTREIRELSPNEMRFRGDNLDRDVRAVLQEPEYKSGYDRKVGVAARFALEVMDHALSHTLWKAAYNDALGKYTEMPEDAAQKKAAYEADSAVRLGLGTSAPKDLPAIMRSNEFNKFITTLYGFHNGVYNQLRDIGHQFGKDRNVGKLTYAAILTTVLPAVLGSWLTGQRPKDDQNPGWWAAKRALLFLADTIPLLRSAASFLDGGHDVQFSPIENVMQKGAKALMDAWPGKQGEKDWLGIGLNAAEAGGELLGVPGSHQAVKTLRYIKRASEGKVQNPNPWNAIVGGG